MAKKPETAAGYPAEQLVLVRGVCLYVATKLNDLMDYLVIVGGFTPSLLIDQEHLPEGADRHPGTLDLDVGLHVAPQGLRRAGPSRSHARCELPLWSQ
jgi:hypothetical protein